MKYGEALATEIRKDGPIPVFSSGGMTGRHDIANTGAPVVVVGRKGSHGSVWWSDVPAFVIDTAYSIDGSNTRGDLRWLYYALTAARLDSLSNDVGVPGLSREATYGLLVSSQPIEEQRRIAHFLDDRVARIDRIIAYRQKQIELLGEQRAAVPDEVLRPADWARQTRMGRAIHRIEQGWSPQCESSSADTDEWGVLKVSAIRPGTFRHEENKRLPDGEEPRVAYEVRDRDLLVTRANTPALVGSFAVVPAGTPRKLIFSDKIMRLDVEDSYLPEYLAIVGQARRNRDALTQAGTGTSQSMVNVRGDDIRSLELPILSHIEQRLRVALWGAEVASIDAQLQRCLQSLELLREYKQSLISAAVTGELDVTSAGSGIPG